MPFVDRMKGWFIDQMAQPPQGGEAPMPTPQGRRQQGMGYRLNPFERNLADSLNVAVQAGLDPQVAVQMLMGTIEGAIGRRQENVAARNEGITGLQQMAMQLAGQGADPTAVSSAVTGMAEDLPGMRGPRGQQEIQGLLDYVSGMYPGGSEISGLAPYDYRAGFAAGPGGLDEERQAAIGGAVVDGVAQGMSMKDIRENVRRDMIGLGFSPDEMAQGIALAENAYEQVTGSSLEDMRMVGDLFRAYEQEGKVENLFDEIDRPGLRDSIESLYGQTQNPTGMLGLLGNQPGAIQTLANDLRPAPAYPGTEQGGAEGAYLRLMNPVLETMSGLFGG